MSVVSTAAAAIAANHAQNAQAMNITALKMKNEAAQSIVQMLEQAVQPTNGSDGSKKVDVKV